MSSEQLPSSIGPYKIIDLLGEGGMGRVYRAVQTALDREVALKVLLGPYAARQDFRERFLREVRLVASLNHPHIVTCHDAGEVDGYLYMALEMVRGGDAQRLLRAGPVPVARALAIIRDCAEGLQAIEERGLVHRDIKPANIFLTASGRAKLADLGLARQVDGGDRLTSPGMPLGTPSYMPPEQAVGGEEVDIRGDIYALGASLYGLLAGAPPFTGSSPIAVLRQVIDLPAPDLRQRRPELPAAVTELVRRCLAKAPAARFASSIEFLQAVEAALHPSANSAPVRQRSETPGESSAAAAVAPAAPAAAVALVDEEPEFAADPVPTPPPLMPQDLEAFRRRLDPAALSRLCKRVHVDQLGLQAWTNLAPGTSMPRALLEIVLEAVGIQYGIHTNAVIAASRPSREARRLVLARGQAPLPGTDGRDIFGQSVPAEGLEIVVEVDPEAMQAVAFVRPGALVDRRQVEAAVRQADIRFGIDRAALARLWEGPLVHGGRLVIARGLAMRAGRPEGFCLGSGEAEAARESIRALRAGALVATWMEAEKGVAGMDVLGRVLPAPQYPVRSPEDLRGEGTELNRDRSGRLVLLATRDGHCQCRLDGVVRVVPARRISGDLGPDDPPLDTDELVIIDGDVLPGAKISSASDVVIMGDLQDACIEAGGCIEIQGDVSPGDGEVIAAEGMLVHGSVRRQVIAGDLRITGKLDHCHVVATGAVQIHRVVGGSVIAGGDLTVEHVGDDLGTTTELWAGHQPGLDQQNRIADLAERRVASERERLLVDIQRQQQRLQAVERRAKMVDGATYQNPDAMKRYQDEADRLVQDRLRMQEQRDQARTRLAEQRQRNRELRHRTDDPDAVLAIQVAAHRGTVLRVADADPLLIRQEQGAMCIDLNQKA